MVKIHEEEISVGANSFERLRNAVDGARGCIQRAAEVLCQDPDLRWRDSNNGDEVRAWSGVLAVVHNTAVGDEVVTESWGIERVSNSSTPTNEADQYTISRVLRDPEGTFVWRPIPSDTAPDETVLCELERIRIVLEKCQRERYGRDSVRSAWD